MARTYLFWAALLPVLSVWCYQLDGIFIGATRSAEMRNAALASSLLFLALWWLFLPYGNHGLWAALTGFNLMRALSLGFYYPRMRRDIA
jgi:MATE family multidrug resistance protein